jgi:hypothetical protein
LHFHFHFLYLSDRSGKSCPPCNVIHIHTLYHHRQLCKLPNLMFHCTARLLYTSQKAFCWLSVIRIIIPIKTPWSYSNFCIMHHAHNKILPAKQSDPVFKNPSSQAHCWLRELPISIYLHFPPFFVPVHSWSIAHDSPMVNRAVKI